MGCEWVQLQTRPTPGQMLCICARALRRSPVHQKVGAAVPRDKMMLLVQEPSLRVVAVELAPDAVQAHPLSAGACVARFSAASETYPSTKMSEKSPCGQKMLPLPCRSQTTGTYHSNHARAFAGNPSGAGSWLHESARNGVGQRRWTRLTEGRARSRGLDFCAYCAVPFPHGVLRVPHHRQADECFAPGRWRRPL